MKKTIFFAIMIFFIVGIYFLKTGDINNNKSEEIIPNEKEISSDTGIVNFLNTFNQISKNERPITAKQFIDDNINDFSQLDADIIITMYIDQLRKYQQIYSEKIFTWEYQIALLDAYDKSYNLTKINNEYSDEIKDYLNFMKDDGFLLNYNEGIVNIFPDYGGLKEYNIYLSDSVRDYIDIISRESSEILSTDKEIIITWDELSYRVLNTEKYIEIYSESIKYDEVYDLYLLYLNTFLSGFKDTPIYYWNTKMIRNDVLQIYNKTIIHNKKTFTAEVLTKYMDIIEKNDNKVEEAALNYAEEIIYNLRESRNLELTEK